MEMDKPIKPIRGTCEQLFHISSIDTDDMPKGRLKVVGGKKIYDTANQCYCECVETKDLVVFKVPQANVEIHCPIPPNTDVWRLD